jgi:iron complex transport system substrate-binding protein
MTARLSSPTRSILAGVAALLALAVTSLASARLDAATLRDAGGRVVTIQDSRRIVSIGGAVTEILYALGLDDHVVAVDTTSRYPARALADKPSVGYMRQLSGEGILGLAPTLVLAPEGAGPKETIAVLENAGVPFVSVPDHFTADGIVERIRMVAEAVGAAARGHCLAGAVEADLAALAHKRRQVVGPLRVMFVLSFVNDRPMVAGTDTAADGIIRLAGGINAIDGYRGYKLVNDEAIVAARPDAVLVMQRPRQVLSADDVLSRPMFSLTPAAQAKRFVSMEGHYLLGFGPRTARAARDLAATLYPGVVGGELPSEATSALDACR